MRSCQHRDAENSFARMRQNGSIDGSTANSLLYAVNINKTPWRRDAKLCGRINQWVADEPPCECGGKKQRPSGSAHNAAHARLHDGIIGECGLDATCVCVGAMPPSSIVY